MEISGDREGLAGRRVLVTGGNRGLGAAIVRRFAEAGATVFAAARTVPADELPTAFVAADLARPGGPEELARRVVELAGGVDILVDNAGAQTPARPILERDDADWAADLGSNFLATVRLDRALVPGMVERGFGVVVHVSSIASRLPRPGMATYAAAKAALNTYSRALAQEVSPQGVRVVNVLPGFVATEGAVAKHREMAEQAGVSYEQFRAELAAQLNAPMGRPGDPADAAELVVFLASERGRWLTGAEYRVDGGILPTA